jgi:type II protein arginine methyltransferase
MVVTHPQTGHQLNIGLDIVSVPRLRESLELAEMSGCDFIMAPLAHPRYERANASYSLPESDRKQSAAGQATAPPPIYRDEPLTRSDLELSSGEWMAGVFAKLSPWIHPDCPHPVLRAASEAAFAEEVAFAAHVSLKALIIPPPNGGAQGVANLARCISAALTAAPSLKLWLRLPVVEPPGRVPAISFNDDADVQLPSEKDMEPWEIWNAIRILCGEHPNLGVALELTAELPSRAALERWVAEPVRVVLLSTTAYVTNRVGYPVLSRRHQDFIKTMFNMRPFFALTGRAQKVKGGEGYRPFVQYLAHLFGKMPGASEVETFESPYYDYLQAPLQPLSDNLESQTYETFERDPVKYKSYEEAIRQCLIARENPSGERAVVMVLGAGRGPLVKCVLRASKAAMKQVTVFAVEKNPNAVVTLRNLKTDLEWENVTIVASDMRRLQSIVQADIVVSELLGSFGDNELSPECLDGANKLLKEGGVSIPSTYSSFLAPLASTKLHNEVRAYGNSLAQMETAYVVRIHRGKVLAPAQSCFSFSHPNRSAVIDNSRYIKMQFQISETNLMHGFAGYFEATLFGDVKLSIRPETASEGMFSWFPLYFPIATPIYAEAGKTVTVHIWRRCSATKVWYEWAVTDPTVTPIHNPNGRSYSFSLN